jgi:NADH-quinone oxidoreductase subunit N
MTVFLLSLAGIPGTAWFIGKFGIIQGALLIDPPLYALVIVMLIATVISYIYYFGLLIQMYVRPNESKARVKINVPLLIVLALCVICTILLGIYPDIAYQFIHTYFPDPSIK